MTLKQFSCNNPSTLLHPFAEYLFDCLLACKLVGLRASAFAAG